MEIIKPSVDNTNGIITGLKKFIRDVILKPRINPPMTNIDMITGSMINIIFLFVEYFFNIVNSSSS